MIELEEEKVTCEVCGKTGKHPQIERGMSDEDIAELVKKCELGNFRVTTIGVVCESCSPVYLIIWEKLLKKLNSSLQEKLGKIRLY